jgi:hypothetical protein
LPAISRPKVALGKLVTMMAVSLIPLVSVNTVDGYSKVSRQSLLEYQKRHLLAARLSQGTYTVIPDVGWRFTRSAVSYYNPNGDGRPRKAIPAARNWANM